MHDVGFCGVGLMGEDR